MERHFYFIGIAFFAMINGMFNQLWLVFALIHVQILAPALLFGSTGLTLTFSSLMVATDSGMSCRFSLRRVAVTTISPTPSVGSATGRVASAAGVSVSPVAWARAGVAAKAQAVASAISEV